MARCGSALIEIGEFGQAEAALRECLAIRELALPAGTPQVWLRYDAMSMLGEALVGQSLQQSIALRARIEKFREAEPLLLGGYIGLKDDPRAAAGVGVGNLDPKKSALARIVSLYEAWHAAEPEKGHDSNVAEWRSLLSTPATQPSPVQTQPALDTAPQPSSLPA